MTKALDNFNACIAALHLTCQIANEYELRLWHLVEEAANTLDADLEGDDYACSIEAASSRIPFKCQIEIRPHSTLQKIDTDLYVVQVQSQFVFSQEAHDYFLRGGHSEIFDDHLQELSASYAAPAIVLGAVDHALLISQQAELKDFKLDGYYESYVRQIAQDRHAELSALLPWLEYFWKRLNATKGRTQFVTLVGQLQAILTQIDRIHKYDFAAYKLLLTMAGDFSPLLNHLSKPPKRGVVK